MKNGIIRNLDDLSDDERKEILLNGWKEELNWDAVKDLLEHSKVMQVRFPIPTGKIELFIPIELMQQATEYAKSIRLDVELHDLNDFIDKTTEGNK